MPRTALDEQARPPRAALLERRQPLTISALIAIIALLLWSHGQSRIREADLTRRFNNFAEGYRNQRDLRRELFLARQTIARLRAGLEVPPTTENPPR